MKEQNKNTPIFDHQQNIDIGEIAFTKEANEPIIKIACGRQHVLALDAKGRVWCWGNNDKGQLGLGVHGPKEIPHQIKKLKDIV